ncbi:MULTISPECIES: CRISPR-associated protein Cas4 [Nostoc]|uniref:CRISPR-associated exonuclease Cas4 n=2 Tax=Nostoc TaxID=1177 RepID=A0ABR8I7B4_9NOSO|nr:MULTISPECIES: CRISPR-associated protein Cas4 [Nostoc]MBD2561783.1 CRISPR-associated protein Cas4 [Nostoc linckia FACHB-391]MBD2647315.1 CRISPR-associated protein Cas4 [Nostoc foliaceum FACHB-393]
MNQTEYISIAALNQYAYCPHRCWRMFCAGEFTDNQYTIEGTTLHDRVHTTSDIQRGETWQIRAIWLKSEQYKLIGKSDLIEAESGQVYPVEYKRGRKGEWDNDELQVCAQALCLEEMTGQPVNTGYIYYTHSHQRQLVEINAELRQSAIATIEAVTNLLETGAMPKPVYSKRCQGCSLYSQCLPKATDKVKSYQEVN